ncbi:MAG: hypothetical protein SGARI_006887, partial [Bacillariaceae sp.]
MGGRSLAHLTPAELEAHKKAQSVATSRKNREKTKALVIANPYAVELQKAKREEVAEERREAESKRQEAEAERQEKEAQRQHEKEMMAMTIIGDAVGGMRDAVGGFREAISALERLAAPGGKKDMKSAAVVEVNAFASTDKNASDGKGGSEFDVMSANTSDGAVGTEECVVTYEKKNEKKKRRHASHRPAILDDDSEDDEEATAQMSVSNTGEESTQLALGVRTKHGQTVDPFLPTKFTYHGRGQCFLRGVPLDWINQCIGGGDIKPVCTQHPETFRVLCAENRLNVVLLRSSHTRGENVVATVFFEDGYAGKSLVVPRPTSDENVDAFIHWQLAKYFHYMEKNIGAKAHDIEDDENEIP